MFAPTFYSRTCARHNPDTGVPLVYPVTARFVVKTVVNPRGPLGNPSRPQPPNSAPLHSAPSASASSPSVRSRPAQGWRPCSGRQGFACGAQRSSPGLLAMLRIASPTPERSPASCAPALDASPLLRCAPTSNELRRPRSLPGPSARPAPMCAAQPPTATAGWAASPAGPVRGARGRTVSFVRPGPPGGDASTAGYSFRSRVYRNSRQTRPFSASLGFGETRLSPRSGLFRRFVLPKRMP